MSMPQDPVPSPSGQPAVSREAARQQVNIPAILLIVTGALTILVALYCIVVYLVQDPGAVELPEGVDPQDMPFDPARLAQAIGVVALLVYLLWAALGGFIIWAGVKMRQLEAYPLALTASILAMIPCLSPCCCIGLPIGIWCVIVLQQTKSGFRG